MSVTVFNFRVIETGSSMEECCFTHFFRGRQKKKKQKKKKKKKKKKIFLAIPPPSGDAEVSVVVNEEFPDSTFGY